ncbi:MAG: dockerin type I domain-containing protein [Lachnospirales bacterium]
MKKLVFLLTTILTTAIFTSISYGAMAKDKITLFGDDNFKAEILKDSTDTIEDNSFFVATDGSDTNDGSISAPFKTVQKALDSVKAGQTIYVRGGTYTANNTFTSSGTEGNYITLRNYPNETPFLTATSSGAIIATNGCDYLKIEGLEIGGLSADMAFGILANSDENHIIIRNNNIHNLVTTKPGENENGEANGILFYAEGGTEELSINNICIENNYVHDNTTGWCESVSVTGNVKYVNIINNRVENNTNIGIDFYGNAGYCPVKSLDQPRYCVAAGNTITGSICSYAECAGLYVDGARDIVLENNKSYNNMYGIEIGSEEGHTTDYKVQNIIVRNNLVYGNSSGGIRVGGYDTKTTGYVTDTKIYNNTVINNGEGDGGWNGELCFVKCDGVDVRNNIVYKDSTQYPMIGGDLAAQYVLNVTFSNNVFYNPLGEDEIYFEFAGGSASGMTAFNSQTGGNDTFGKPVFNSDYSLQKDSYGIDIGSNDVISYMGNLVDYLGNYRVINTIDAGAFEYQDGSYPTVSTTTETTTETTTSQISDTPSTGGFIHNFTENGITSSFYTITGNLSTGKGSVTYKGLTLTQCLKMESSTSIKFTNTNKGKLTLVFGGSTSAVGKSVLIDSSSYTVGSDNTVTVDLEAGSHSVSKGDSINLFYISYSDDSSEYVIGDVNCDGNIDKSDVQMVLDYASGKITSITNSNLGDFSGDGNITAYDAYLIGKIILGLK